MDFVIGLFVFVGILVLLYYASRIIIKMPNWIFILIIVSIIFGLIAKYAKDNTLTSSAEPNVVQAIEKEKVKAIPIAKAKNASSFNKEQYEEPDEVPEILNAYSESELEVLFKEIVAYQDLAVETAYNVWGVKNEFYKEAGLYNELDSISKIEFLLKHNLTKDFYTKLVVYGTKKRWAFD